MKLFATCHKCMGEDRRTFPTTSDFVWNDLGEINDDAAASGVCPLGHAISVIVQSPRHVLLFDSACLAFLDGYYREAIGSFAASLERLYEFAVRVMCRHRQIDPATLDETWKIVGRRSEAQIGAFLFLYGLHTGKPAKKWPHDQLRNEIVHKGLFPTRAAALEYGEACYHRILDVTDELRRSAVDALEAELASQFSERAGRVTLTQGQPLQTILMGTSPVATEVIRHEREPLLQALEFLERYPMWIHPADRLSVGQVARDASLSVHEVYTLARDGSLALELKRAIEKRRAQARGSRSIDRVLRQRRPTTLSGRLR